MVDLVVVGGGASGVMAALAAIEKNPALAVLILEASPRILKKVSLSGNGRCNLSNLSKIQAYHGGEPSLISSVLTSFSPQETLLFFEKLGLLIRTEADGRIYPYTGQAASVLDVLRFALNASNITIRCDFPVIEIKKADDSFFLSNGTEIIKTKKVIISCGGKASPVYKENDPLSLLKKLGHTVTPSFPALSPIKTDRAAVSAYKGIRVPCNVSLQADGKQIRREEGELQFTETGLSGICIFQLSRLSHEYFILGTVNGMPAKSLQISVDLLPQFSLESLTALLNKRTKTRTPDQIFTGMLPSRIGSGLVKTTGQPDALALAKLAKNWNFTPAGISPWISAQVMAGGISMNEIRNDLQSKLISNLYFCGEILDVDGDCGGFNLQWAWSSGYVAGKSAANS